MPKESVFSDERFCAVLEKSKASKRYAISRLSGKILLELLEELLSITKKTELSKILYFRRITLFKAVFGEIILILCGLTETVSNFCGLGIVLSHL